MPQSTSRNRFRACVLTAALVFAPAIFADVVQSTPALPPVNGGYSVPDTCVSVVCLENITLSNFVITSNSIAGGNELTSSDVTLSANVFQNVAGGPGKFISPLTLSGDVDITYFSRSSLDGLGSFNAQITGLDLTGSFVGLTGEHTVEAMLNPLLSSTGETTIDKIASHPPIFNISSFFDVFAELKIDNGPFVPGPERVANLVETPEPGYYAAIGLVLAVLVLRRAIGTKRGIAARSLTS